MKNNFIEIIIIMTIIVIAASVMTINNFLFQDNKHDFQVAKVKKEVITCKGWFKTYVIEPDDYIIYENHIEANIMHIPRNFDLSKCNVENNTNK